MQGSGQYFLAHSGLTAEEHRRIGFRGAGQFVDDGEHRRRLRLQSDLRNGAPQLIGPLHRMSRQIMVGSKFRHDLPDLLRRKGFCDKVRRASFDRFDGGIGCRESREHDDRELRVLRQE